MTKVFIDGKEGTTGLKIFERFANRKDIELLVLDEKDRKNVNLRAEMINNSDITFLCLPDVASIEAVGLISNNHTKIIDASTAHRTDKEWAYGFPELGQDFRDKIASSNKVAVAGCHASGFLSIVYPLVKIGILPNDYPLVCYSLTGYSGGGKKMIASYNAGNDNSLLAPNQYGVTQMHKHLKEMTAIPELKYQPIFAPIVDDYFEGMEVSVPLYTRLLNGVNSVTDVYNYLANYYANQKMVSVKRIEESFANGFIPANYMAKSNKMEILVGGNDERIMLISLFDNLGKGASGSAVQCMNIMLGLDETTGLV